MVEFKFRQHNGRMYLPKELQEVIQGRDVKAIADYRAALIFDARVSYEDVEKSLQVISSDISHRIENPKLGKRQNRARVNLARQTQNWEGRK